MSILGHPVVRREDPRFLTGQARYVEDLPLAGAGWLTYVRSPYAHGRLVGIDTSAAATMPGVLGVFTAADLAGFGPAPHIMPILPAGTERPVLAVGVVRYVGEAVAAVVATDRYLAADAADAVVVDIEPLEVLIEPGEAVRDEILLFPDLGTNALLRFEAKTTADFEGCDIVVELDIENQRVHSAPLEPRSGAAEWTDDGRLVHYAACQGAHPARDALCALYGLAKEQVRVVVPTWAAASVPRLARAPRSWLSAGSPAPSADPCVGRRRAVRAWSPCRAGGPSASTCAWAATVTGASPPTS